MNARAWKLLTSVANPQNTVEFLMDAVHRDECRVTEVLGVHNRVRSVH